jgi:hypothetical protein
VRKAALIAVLLVAAGSAVGDGTPGSATPPQDMRSQLVSEFKFAPPPPVPAVSAPFLTAGTAPPPAPTQVPADVVTMAPFTVLDTVKMTRLSDSISQRKAAAHTAMMMDKLGVGIHVVSVGCIRLYAGTIFYIPFTAGVGISW